jgi:hypothetical protein
VSTKTQIITCQEQLDQSWFSEFDHQVSTSAKSDLCSLWVSEGSPEPYKTILVGRSRLKQSFVNVPQSTTCNCLVLQMNQSVSSTDRIHQNSATHLLHSNSANIESNSTISSLVATWNQCRSYERMDAADCRIDNSISVRYYIQIVNSSSEMYVLRVVVARRNLVVDT